MGLRTDVSFTLGQRDKIQLLDVCVSPSKCILAQVFSYLNSARYFYHPLLQGYLINYRNLKIVKETFVNREPGCRHQFVRIQALFTTFSPQPGMHLKTKITSISPTEITSLLFDQYKVIVVQPENGSWVNSDLSLGQMIRVVVDQISFHHSQSEEKLVLSARLDTPLEKTIEFISAQRSVESEEVVMKDVQSTEPFPKVGLTVRSPNQDSQELLAGSKESCESVTTSGEPHGSTATGKPSQNSVPIGKELQESSETRDESQGPVAPSKVPEKSVEPQGADEGQLTIPPKKDPNPPPKDERPPNVKTESETPGRYQLPPNFTTVLKGKKKAYIAPDGTKLTNLKSCWEWHRSQKYSANSSEAATSKVDNKLKRKLIIESGSDFDLDSDHARKQLRTATESTPELKEAQPAESVEEQPNKSSKIGEEKGEPSKSQVDKSQDSSDSEESTDEEKVDKHDISAKTKSSTNRREDSSECDTDSDDEEEEGRVSQPGIRSKRVVSDKSSSDTSDFDSNRSSDSSRRKKQSTRRSSGRRVSESSDSDSESADSVLSKKGAKNSNNSNSDSGNSSDSGDDKGKPSAVGLRGKGKVEGKMKQAPLRAEKSDSSSSDLDINKGEPGKRSPPPPARFTASSSSESESEGEEGEKNPVAKPAPVFSKGSLQSSQSATDSQGSLPCFSQKVPAAKPAAVFRKESLKNSPSASDSQGDMPFVSPKVQVKKKGTVDKIVTPKASQLTPSQSSSTKKDKKEVVPKTVPSMSSTLLPGSNSKKKKKKQSLSGISPIERIKKPPKPKWEGFL